MTFALVGAGRPSHDQVRVDPKIATANPHLYHRDVERIVKVVFDEIVEALSRGDRVELRGFGAFTVKHRAPRDGRNPRTGASVSVAEKFVPFFKTGKELRERLNTTRAEKASRRVAIDSDSYSPHVPTATAIRGCNVLRRIVWQYVLRLSGSAPADHPCRRQSA